MAGHQLQILTAQLLRREGGDIFVGRAVEAVAADAVLPAQLGRQGVEKGLRRHAGVKAGLKGADQRYAGQNLRKLADGTDVGGIVGGGDGIIRRHGGQHRLAQFLHAGHALGMHHLKAHAGDFLQRLNGPSHEKGQHLFNGLPVGGQGQGEAFGAKMILVGKGGAVAAHPLRLAGGQHAFALVHVKQLIFQRGASDVANQYLHE
ncbi:hypothetical protein SDC9_166468 [bioreactor metagenome]|uniref:Uncharacterized protein n=1 Tax=bioreactor metagenome TaxID=1076179 RepID=A0A645FZI0_9ZZZZ